MPVIELGGDWLFVKHLRCGACGSIAVKHTSICCLKAPVAVALSTGVRHTHPHHAGRFIESPERAVAVAIWGRIGRHDASKGGGAVFVLCPCHVFSTLSPVRLFNSGANNADVPLYNTTCACSTPPVTRPGSSNGSISRSSALGQGAGDTSEVTKKRVSGSALAKEHPTHVA